MNLKIFYLLAWLSLCGGRAVGQDLIIFRDGRMKPVRIVQTNSDKTLYKASGDKHAPEEFVDNKDVYMLKFKKRGNVVFNGRGERILSTYRAEKMPKDAIVVYYNDGREVPAYNVTMDENTVTLNTGKKGKTSPVFSPKTEIFMICYPDGTRDILTNLASDAASGDGEAKAAVAEGQQEQADTAAIGVQDEAESRAAAPRRATIITKKGVRMKVWVCEDDGKTVSYMKSNTPKASIFKIGKSRIRNIKYR